MPIRRIRPLLLASCLAIALASCATPTPPQNQAWAGTTTSADGTFPLTIATTLTPDGAWTGTYTVDRTPSFTGDVDATLVGGVLEGVLVVSDECTFDLTGTVAGDALDAAFSPADCPGGTAGTWSATRTAPSSTTTAPSTSEAIFDGDATFGAARFR